MEKELTHTTNTISNSLSHQEKEEKIMIPERFHPFFETMAKIASFIGRFFKNLFTPPFETTAFLEQCYKIGYQSLLLIGITAAIAGVVFSQQSRPSLVAFGAQSWLPSFVAIAVVRSLGPLITALICSGKVASNIAAELSSMRVTEQIDAMEVSATKPFKYLVVTRILAATIMIPILTIFADTLSLMSSFLSVNILDQTNFNLFFTKVFESISFLDIIGSISKTVFFGFAIGAVACYKGYYASKGTVGVGKAANGAVVTSMFLIFIIDLLALQVITFFR
ncbi:MAG: ABC transporter permease [Flammeovirgaceae bacterium]|nr:ABC transporter permease [Flammeovirgaceae bacterium]